MLIFKINMLHCSPPGVCAINGLLYVIGGDDGSCNLSSVEFYNPATDKWSLIPTNMSNGRSYAGRSPCRQYFYSTGRNERDGLNTYYLFVNLLSLIGRPVLVVSGVAVIDKLL